MFELEYLTKLPLGLAEMNFSKRPIEFNNGKLIADGKHISFRPIYIANARPHYTLRRPLKYPHLYLVG